MMGPVDCQVFGDQMDALVRGTLPAEGARQLRLHAAECRGCALQLRVQEHLVGPSLEALEARVPPALLESMEDRVMAAVRRGVGAGSSGSEAGPGGSAGGVVSGRIGPRLVPWLAAASVALAASTGILAREVASLREDRAVLAMEVEARRAQVEGLRASGGAGTASTGVRRAAALGGVLGPAETVTVAALVEFLQGLPPGRVVMTEEQVLDLLRRPGPLGQPAFRSLAGRISPQGGVTAGDLAAALTGPGIGPELEIDARRLRELLS